MPAKRKRMVAVEEQRADATASMVSSESQEPKPLPETEVISRRSTRTRKKAILVKPPPDIVDLGYESPLTELDDDEASQEPKAPSKKRRRRKKDVEPIVYDIPPVETKQTTFKGRLGYACLNTVLRALKPDPIFCSRTCRKDTIHKNGLDFAKDLGRQNCRDLCKLIQWNEENNIKFLRLSSEMFPFASHAELGYDLEYASEELKAAGDLAKKYGHRLTAHPGQFTQLGSPKDAVVAASVRELEYHCQMMRYMGLDQDSVMIIHMGGVYGDKETAIARFKENYSTKLSDEMKARLVLENDEMCYSADDLLPVCEELGIPLVFDYHHNWINPTCRPLPELISSINAIWYRKGIKPKQHLSSPRPGAETVMEKRAHSDRCYELPLDLPDDMDLMIEAKDKEQAVLHLYRIYNLHPVIHENLRPEKPPKPFPRAQKGEGDETKDDEGNGEPKDTDEGSSKPERRNKKMTVSKGKNDQEEPVQLEQTAATSKSKKARKSPRQRRKAKQAVADLINLEEVIEPVDGSGIEVVEAEEHPEVSRMADEGQDGEPDSQMGGC